MLVPSLFADRRNGGVDMASALAGLSAADPKLGAVIARVGPCPLTRPQPVTTFAYLLRAITYQQLATAAARTIHGRVVDLFPRKRPTPEALLALAPERLRAAGLSTAKTASARSLAEHALAGTVPPVAALRRMAEDDIIARLTQVRGIGTWTVEMFLIFHLGRPDVFPWSDLGIRKGFAKAIARARPADKHGLPLAPQMQRRAERWRPFRSLATWYLWRALEI